MTPTDLEAFDRLEQKVKLLVSAIGRLRSERDKLAEDNRRLTGELDETRARLNEVEGSAAEIEALQQERALVRSRVAEMLDELEGLNL
jgi:FtsZ-binding cell division protein ZapB